MSKEANEKLISGLFAEYRQMMFKIAMGILHNKTDSKRSEFDTASPHTCIS